MVQEEADGDDQVNQKKSTQPQAAAWCTPSATKQAQPKRRLPAFSVWQAGQLFGRDVMFGSFLLLTFFLYLRSTVPELCSVGPPPPNNSSTTWNNSTPALQPDEWSFAFRLVCGHVQDSINTWNSDRLKTVFSSYLGLDSVIPSSNLGRGHIRAIVNSAQSPTAASTGLHRGFGILLSGLLDLLAMLCAVLGLSVLKGLVYVGQAVFTFFACGFLTGDPFHVVIPPLRLGLVVLLLLPLPLPALAAWPHRAVPSKKQANNSSRVHSSTSTCTANAELHAADSCSDSRKKHSSSSCWFESSSGGSYHLIWYRPSYWWQYPQFRTAVIVLQRLLPPATAALSVGRVGARFFDLTALRYWPLLGQYMYLGWTAWMLVVPLEVHVVVNLIEWLLVYSTTVRVRMVHYDSPLICTTHLTHLLASLVLLLLLPTAGVAWLERSHRASYQQAKSLLEQQQHAGRAAACDEQEQDDTQQCSGSGKAQGTMDSGSPVGSQGLSDKKIVVETPLRHSSLQRRRRQQQQQQQPARGQVQQSTCQAPGQSGTVSADAAGVHSSSKGDLAAAADTIHTRSLQAAAADISSGSRRRHTRTCSVPAINSYRSIVTNGSSSGISQSVGGGSSSTCVLGDQLVAEINSSLQLAAIWAAKHQPINGSSNTHTHRVPFDIDHLLKQSRTAAAAQPAAANAAAQPAAAVIASTPVQSVSYRPYAPAHRAVSLPPLAADCSGIATGIPSTESSCTSAATADAPTDSAAACGGLFVVPDLAPAIKSLIGDQQAAAVFAAAAAASAQVEGGPQPGMVPYYTSRAPRQSWNVGLQLA